MTLSELIDRLLPMQREYGKYEVIVPTGMDCDTARNVEVVRYNPETKVTRANSVKVGAPWKQAILIHTSEEPRP